MGVMTKEIKKLRGRSAFLKSQEHLDALGEAQMHRKIEDMNQTYLKQLYYGLETLLDRVSYQEDMIRELVDKVNHGTALKRVKFKMNKKQSELSKALSLINNYLDANGRIMWRKVDDPKELIFAYIKKAESEGLNIESTMDMQRIPQYRRAFQYVAYNLGSWKDIVEEYYDRKRGA